MGLSVSVTPFRSRLRSIEVTLSVLLLAAVALNPTVGSTALGEWILWIVFVVPGLLGIAALVGAGIDAYATATGQERDSQRSGASRWVVVGRLAVAGVIGALAIVTLFLVVQTILVVTVIDTGGGVVFGPILYSFAGSVLAVVVLLRSAGEILSVVDWTSLADRSSR